MLDKVLDSSLNGRRRKCALRKNKGNKHLPRVDRPHCPRSAVPGKLYCRRHARYESLPRKIAALPQMYRLVSRSLQRRLDELEAEQEKRLSLLVELDLVRISADEAVERYGEAKDLKEIAELALEQSLGTDNEKQLREATELARQAAMRAGEVMRDVLGEVKSFVIAAQHVRKAGSDTITPEMVRTILNQCALLLYEVCGDDHEDLAARFEALVYDRVCVNVEEREWVPPKLTIDNDLRRMLSSVPECAGEVEAGTI